MLICCIFDNILSISFQLALVQVFFKTPRVCYLDLKFKKLFINKITYIFNEFLQLKAKVAYSLIPIIEISRVF